jgi:hypothetical protein
MARQALAHDSRQATGKQPPQQVRDNGASSMDELFAAWMGVPWMNMWVDTWRTWLQQCDAAMPRLQDTTPVTDDRRQAAVPWLPQLETTVIPFRRREDAQGVQATRLSLRFRVPAFPWLPGSNSIAIDTVVPRGTETTNDDLR